MKYFCVAILFSVLLIFAASARGDLFVLQSGGEISGELVNREESPRQSYVIETVEGGRITIAASQLKQIVPQSAQELEYEKIRADYGDNVEEQWKLAEWCRENNLTKQRTAHLERIIALDKDHAAARRALGYSLYDGVWMTQEQWHQKRGFVRYAGRWRLPQEVELLEKSRKVTLDEKKWKSDVAKLRNALEEGGTRREQATETLLTIQDSNAVPALREALTRESLRPVKLLYIQSLKNIGSPAAYKTIVDCSLLDPDEEVRLTCLDQLTEGKHPDAVSQFAQALRSKENHMVIRAAIGLKHLSDPSSVSPLIDALVTTHKYKVAPSNPGSMTSSFGSDGSTGFSTGGNKPTIYREKVANQPVLDALIKITGQNFEFNVQAWRRWYAGQKANGGAVDFRRG